MTLRTLDPFELPLGGTQLIEASAGTGKTYTITSIVLRLLLERGLTVEQIVVVTFTKAATFELRERIRRRIDEAERAFRAGQAEGDDALLVALLRRVDRAAGLARLRAAQRALDHSAVFTIHGFAQRMLQEHAFESGARFDLELVGDQRALISEVVHDFWSSEVASLPEELWKLLSGVDAKSLLSPKAFASLAYVAVAFPDLPLHGSRPARDEVSAPARLLERREARSRAALSALAACRSEVVAEFRRDGEAALAALSPTKQHGTYYSFEKLGAMHAALSALSHGEEVFGLPKPLEYLTSEKLDRYTKKKLWPVPKHALYDAMDAYARACAEVDSAAEELLDELRTRMVEFARERIVLEHRQAGTQSFDDLLHGLCAALRHKAGSVLARRIRERYPVALIDEFQDTDPTQYEIFRTIYASPEAKAESKNGAAALFLIGDPKQAIYAFRGADVFAYIAAAKDAADQAWTLSTNRRSDPGLLRALNTLFGRLPQPFLIDSIRYVPVSAPAERSDQLFSDSARVTPLELVHLPGEGSEPPSAAQWSRLAALEVARVLRSGVRVGDGEAQRLVEPRDIAVLTRTNAQAQDIQAELRALRVPSVLAGDRSVFQTVEAEELAHVMRAMAEPSSPGAVRTALATRFLNVDAHEIARLAEDEAAWELWVTRFRQCHTLWTNSGFVHAVQHLFRELDVVSRTLSLAEGERRLTNARHLIELLHGAETSEHLGVIGLVQWFDQARVDPEGQGMAPEAQQLRLESDADAVTLTTMHKSKGLEYPIVVLPSLGNTSEPFSSEKENLRFHNPEHGDRLELDVRLPAHKPEALAIGKHEHRAEALRLAYVALTRAKHHLVVLCGRGARPGFSALGYLLHQPAVSLGGLDVDIEARLKSLDEEERLSEMEQVAADSSGTIRVRRARLDSVPEYEAAPRPLPRLAARVLARRVPEGARTSSFSAMTRGAAHALSPQARAGRDVDEVVPAAAAGSAPPAAPESGIVLADFPRGAAPGELLHAVLEHCPFAEGDAKARAEIAERELKRAGFDAAHLPALKQAIEDVLATSLDARGEWSLGSLQPSARVAEMEFLLPVSAPVSGRVLTARRLAQALGWEDSAQSGARSATLAREEAPWGEAYLEQVAKLPFVAWSGFLRGFIDLVFERDGRFFVLDYKSNYLGGTADDYGPAQMRAAMAEHHYHLQYLLYSVALHRHLTQRVARYDYETHFGGVYYLFVRGMHPENGSRGVFFHRPSKALVERLSALLEDPAPHEDGAPKQMKREASLDAVGEGG